GKIEFARLDAISEHLVRPRRYNKGARFAVDIRVGSRDSAERYAQLEHAIFGVSVSGILKGVASSLRLLGLRAFVERPPPSHNWRIGWIRLAYSHQPHLSFAFPGFPFRRNALVQHISLDAERKRLGRDIRVASAGLQDELITANLVALINHGRRSHSDCTVGL